MPFFIHTLQSYDSSAYKPVGQVVATHVEAVSRGRAFLADIVGMFGNKSDLMTKKLDDAVSGVLKTLQEKTLAQYPDAAGIVGVHYSLSEISGDEKTNFISILGSGTVLAPRSNTRQSTGGRRQFRRKRTLRSRLL